MMNTDYGIISLEASPAHTGLAVWELSIARRQGPAIYAYRMHEYSHNRRDTIWSESRMRTAGSVHIDETGATFEYGRYEASTFGEFSYMCNCCLRNMWPALVVPGSAQDNDAICLIEDLWSDERAFPDHSTPYRPVRKIMYQRCSAFGWAYVLGFVRRDPITVFMTGSPAAADFVRGQAATLPGHQILQRW